MERWSTIALEEGIRFFVTSLGNPAGSWTAPPQVGGIVYHDVTERKWAQKGLDGGVHGLIAVNARAGGHAGPKSAEQLYDELADLGVPLICAGGIGTPKTSCTRCAWATPACRSARASLPPTECTASDAYKRAIVDAGEDDIVLSERITGVPLAVIRTPYVERMGTKAGPIARRMLRGRRTKHWMRAYYAVRSAVQLKKASLDPSGTKDFWQAGRSVAGVSEVLTVAEIVNAFVRAAAPEREDRSVGRERPAT
jgi:nitronate monooxygenase